MFSERYWDICRLLQQLHPRQLNDWRSGDYCLDHNRLEVCLNNRQPRPVWKSLVKAGAISDRGVWLPSRESDWMALSEWPDTQFLGVEIDAWEPRFEADHPDGITHDRILTLFSWTDSGMETSFLNLDDPLLACAEVWLKTAVEAGAFQYLEEMSDHV